MQKILISTLLASVLPLLSACSDWSLPEVPTVFPEIVHKITIQQGNIINQAMINKLRPGMLKRQVRFIMGSPMINDTFHEDRWDYIYRIHRSTHAPTESTRVTLFFEQDKLARIEGDMRPLEDQSVKQKTEVVEVPYQERNLGIFDRALGLVGLEQEDAPATNTSSGGGSDSSGDSSGDGHGH